MIYGGVIYPPDGAQYYPPAIVAVVVFGPVFAQSWFFGPTGVIVWSMTIFYRPGGVRIWNPGMMSLSTWTWLRQLRLDFEGCSEPGRVLQ